MTTLVEEEPTTPDRGEPVPIPGIVKRRLERGRAQRDEHAAVRRVCYRFRRGDAYSFVDGKGLVQTTPTLSVTMGGKKPPWRIRNRYNFVGAIVDAKISAATQRIPSYQVLPSKLDPEAGQAAALSEKVLLWGYDEWRLRRVTTKCFEHALVGGEGFAYPFFDNTVGPYVQDPNTGEHVGEGQIGVKVLSANEVGWEPGTDFEESRWYFIDQARPIDTVKEMPGYLGGDLAADATDSDLPTDSPKDDLVRVTEYFQRPSAKEPRGQRLVMAAGRLILKPEDYPCMDAKGNVLDEPVLLRISYTVETDDRDRGLVEQILDLQRTVNDCWNKILEWKNRALNPQMIVPRGSNMARKDDQPGAQWSYTPVAGLKPEWESPPPIPRELFQILDKAIEHLRALSADVDVQPDPRLTAQTAQSAIEQAQLRWQSFLGDGAEFHSRLGRRCLYLVQRHFTEPRLLKIQGMFGPDLTPGFRGADLLGEADVRVSPDSLVAKSRQQVIQDTLMFADRGWLTPQAAMATIQGGVAEKLGVSWQFHVDRANFIIQTIKRGEKALFALPDRPPFPGEAPPVDPTTGQPLLIGKDGQMKIPGYMPRPFDNVEIQKQVFETWMLTTDWDHLPDPMKQAATVYYQALLSLETSQKIQAAQQQEQIAQAQGMANAARPQDQTTQPSQKLPQLQGPQGAQGGQSAT